MKKTIKRFLCGILTLSLCLGCVCSAEADNTPVSQEMKDSMEVLRLFGIIADYYDYNTLMSEEVSRADFVNTVAALVKANEYKTDGLYYYDVPKNHYAYSSICALTEMGVINGTGEKKFSPEEPIEVGAAYKILLSLMGYNHRADYDGGYPNGYIKIAKRLNLYGGGELSGNLTRGEMLVAIYNAMKTNIYEATSYSDEGTGTYRVSGQNTLLSVYHSIYFNKGIVNGAEMATLDGSRLGNAAEVKIGGMVYDSDVELFDYLGEEVEFFYYYDKTLEEGRVLWARNTGRTKTLKIDEENLNGFNRSSFVLSYYGDNGRSIDLALDRNITVLYNGVEVTANTYEIFELPAYSIKLAGADGSYTTAIIESADSYVVDRVDLTADTVYSKINPTAKLTLKENAYEYLVIKDTGGRKMSLSEILEGMTLSVYESRDKSYAKVIVSSAKISGKVEKIRNTSGGKYITVGDCEWFAPSAAAVLVPDAGENVTIYADHKERVVYISTVTGDYFAAYVYLAGVDEQAFDSTPMIKVFTQSGENIKYDCAEKVVCDGKLQSDPQKILAVLNEVWGNTSSKFKPQLALLKLNSEGRVREIDTAYVNAPLESEEDTLSLNVPYTNLTYKWTGIFEGKSAINSSTVIFNVPPDAAVATADDKSFKIKGMADFVDAVKYNIETYKTKERVGYEQFIVLKSDLGDSYNDQEPAFLVKEKIQIINEEGDAAEALVGYSSAIETTVGVENDVSLDGIKEGMLLRVKYNYKGEIEYYSVLFDPETHLDANGRLTPAAQTNSQFGEAFGIVRGYVHDVVDEVVKIGRTDPAVWDQLHFKFGAPILIYDSSARTEKISAGSFSDAKTYRNDLADCSIIVMQTYYGATPKMFVIYK